MTSPKRIVIIAGEESGDRHAATFVRELKQTHPHIHISGIGGEHMHDAGVELISDLARYGVMGVSAVFSHLRVILRAAKAIKAHLMQHPPDLLILVDYPGFNLRLAKFVKKNLNTRIIYYISPQIWAWKAKRIHTIKACVDHMAVILPFEKSIYLNAQVPVSFVGHPLIERLRPANPAVTRATLGLPEQARILALLPGSRVHEIKHHMPILRDCALLLTQRLDDLHIVIPIARTIKPQQIQTYLKNVPFKYTLIQEHSIDVVRCSDAVIVASGTASLECALLQKPMCIIYKSSLLSYALAWYFIQINFLGLCNILQNQMIVSEFLQYDCNAAEIARHMHALLTCLEKSQRLTRRLQQLYQSLTLAAADCSMHELIVRELERA